MIRSRKGLGRAEGEPPVGSRDGAGDNVEHSGNHYDFFWGERWSNTLLRRALVVSACLHVVVIAFFPSAAYKPRIIEFPPLYKVQLVQIEPEQRAPPKKPAPKEPEKKPVVQPEKKAPTVVTPPVKQEKKPEPERPKVAEKPPKEAEKEEKPPEKAAAPKVETKAQIEVDLPQWYIDTIVGTVRRHWEEPTATAGGTLQTIVYFNISRSGEVASPQIEKSSGDRRWDLAALRAVVESRFPPWPAEFKENKLGVHFSFKHEGKTTTQ
jgi:TonB family protein